MKLSSILVHILNVYAVTTTYTGLGELTFGDYDDYWPNNIPYSPAYSFDDLSRPYDVEEPRVSLQHFEHAWTNKIELPSNMNYIEELFIKLNTINGIPLVYQSESNNKWQALSDNNTVSLQSICFAAWTTEIPNKKCESEAKPYSKSRIQVEFYVTQSYNKLLGADVLRCKCYPDRMKREVRSKIKALYLAKHNDSSVFILTITGDPRAHKLRIIGMMPLNLTDITLSSSVKPPNRTSSPLTWNLTQIEKEFYMMYNNFSDEVKWQKIRDNNTYVLRRICTAAWEADSNKKCHAESRPYRDPKCNGMKARLSDMYDAISVRADFLLCRCTNDSQMPRRRIRMEIDPIYFTKYDSRTVFKLIILGDVSSHNLKISNGNLIEFFYCIISNDHIFP